MGSTERCQGCGNLNAASILRSTWEFRLDLSRKGQSTPPNLPRTGNITKRRKPIGDGVFRRLLLKKKKRDGLGLNR